MVDYTITYAILIHNINLTNGVFTMKSALLPITFTSLLWSIAFSYALYQGYLMPSTPVGTVSQDSYNTPASNAEFGRPVKLSKR